MHWSQREKIYMQYVSATTITGVNFEHIDFRRSVIGLGMQDIVQSFVRGLVQPSGIISYLLLAGIPLFFWQRHRNKSKYMFTTAMIFFVVFGSGPVSFWLLGSLEFRYTPYEEAAGNKDVEDIVLLAGYAESDGDMPLSSYVNDSSAIRILEAARIFRLKPGRRIIVSGKDDVPMIMKEVLMYLGFPDKSIIIERNSGSTIASAVNLSKTLKEKRIILITSAGHMHRAVLLFRKHGMDPIAAPTDFMTRRNYLATGYLPKPIYIRLSDLAIHEYVGIYLCCDNVANKSL